jgi:hypothetical protein
LELRRILEPIGIDPVEQFLAELHPVKVVDHFTPVRFEIRILRRLAGAGPWAAGTAAAPATAPRS